MKPSRWRLSLTQDTISPEEAICAHIREHLRSSRVPEVMRFADELPYNETGKLLRRVVKEWF